MTNTQEFSKNILLTGAGFTHNFGTPLADDMWLLLFNNLKIQGRKIVRELMLKYFYEPNYEDIYNLVLSEDKKTIFDAEDKKTINEAMLEAYKFIDETVSKSGGDFDVNINNLNKSISLFSQDKGKICCFFTLNQDLFIERHYSSNADSNNLVLPGISTVPVLSNSNRATYSLTPGDFLVLPIDGVESIPLRANEFNYIKLHGSYNWKRSAESSAMVIGSRKKEQIEKIPLLKKYSEIFEKALCQENAKLLVIGYGFGDDNINEIIAKAVDEFKLKIFVISPEELQSFFVRMNHNTPFPTNSGKIYTGLTGYFKHKLSEIFPNDGKDTPAYKGIKDGFFS